MEECWFSCGYISVSNVKGDISEFLPQKRVTGSVEQDVSIGESPPDRQTRREWNVAMTGEKMEE